MRCFKVAARRSRSLFAVIGFFEYATKEILL